MQMKIKNKVMKNVSLSNTNCALSLNEEKEEEYFDYDFFRDTLDVVLEDHRPKNAPDWWEEEADSWDLDTWSSRANNVCAVLGVVGAESQAESNPQTGEAEQQ